MKTKHLVRHVVLCLFLPYSALGQASFQFISYNPNYGVNAHVFDAGGQMLVGTNYLAELWGGSTSNAISPLVTVSELKRVILPLDGDGYVISGKSFLSVLEVYPYDWAWLQMRAWDARLGGTYEEVIAQGLGGYGESPLFYAQGHNPLAVPPETPAPLIGLQSFSLRAVVPEPSTWALLALGGLGFAWAALHRKSKQP